MTALSNLGVIVGATVGSQAWSLTGDVRNAVWVACACLILAVVSLVFVRRDRPATAGPAAAAA